MMDLGTSNLDQLLSDPNREGQVGQEIPMQMPKLAAAEAKLDPTKAVRRLLDTGPAKHLPSDSSRGG